MNERTRRALLSVVLVAALAAMAVHYGAVAESHDRYPSADALAGDYEAHVGDRVFMWTTVIAVDGRTLAVRSDPAETVVLDVTPAPAGVEPGDVVQVYGTLEPDHRVDAHRVVVSERGNRRSMFAVSALAVLLTAGHVLREWTVDWRDLALVPRGERDA